MLWLRVCGCGGPALSPWLARPLGVACRRGGGGPSPGGWPSTVVRGIWCQALSLARPPVHWGGQPGFRDPCVPGAFKVGFGTQHRPHIVRHCEPSLCAVGLAEGRPRGGAFRRCEERLRSGAPPLPAARPLGGLSGSATHMLWARVCGCGGPALSPWLACPVGAACRRDGGGPSLGGVACHRCEGSLVSGAVPPPAAHPLGRAAGVPQPVCPGCGWCGRGDPAPAPQRVPFASRRCALRGWREGVPWGVSFAVVMGVWGQALPLPRLPALWAGCLGPLPTCCVRGCAGVGAQHWPRGSHALWRAARRGGGGGASGFRRPPFSGCPPSGRAAGARWPRAVGGVVAVCSVCGVCAVRAVVRGAVLCLSPWCPPLRCLVAVLCSSCACPAPFPARVPRLSAGYLLSLSWFRRSLPFPLLSVWPPSSLACTFSLPPPWCLSRSISLPASLVSVPGSSSFCPARSCETGDGLGCGLLGSGTALSGRVGVGSALHTSLVTFVRCLSRLCAAVWHVTYLHLSLLTHVLSCFACCGGGTPVVPSYHVACPWRWRSCLACGVLLVRAGPSFPVCAACWGGCGSPVCVWAYLSLLLPACGGGLGSRLFTFVRCM